MAWQIADQCIVTSCQVKRQLLRSSGWNIFDCPQNFAGFGFIDEARAGDWQLSGCRICLKYDKIVRDIGSSVNHVKRDSSGRRGVRRDIEFIARFGDIDGGAVGRCVGRGAGR